MKKITLLFMALIVSNVALAQYFTEDFEGGVFPPAGWTLNQVNTNETWEATPDLGVGGTAGATIAYDALLGNQDESLVTPMIDLTGATNPRVIFNINMSYFWSVNPNDNYDITVSVIEGLNTTQIWTETDNAEFDSNDDNFVYFEIELDLSAYAGDMIQLEFNYTGQDGAGATLDDITVDEAPSCSTPGGFTAGDITATTFEFSWTDPNTGTPTWEIEWGAEGFTQGSGTPVTNLTTTTYTFPGLTADTPYEFYIRTNCGGGNGDSEWVGPVAFLSGFDCTAGYALPFSDNFANGNAYASCYSVEDGNTDNTTWVRNTGNDFNGDTVNDPVAVIFPQAANVAKDDWLFLPVINGTANATYTFTVLYNAFNNPAPSANESFELVVLDSPSSAATSQTVLGTFDNITQNGAGLTDLVPNAYTDNVEYTPTSDGDFYLAIHATSAAANSGILLVFNVSVDEVLSVSEFESNTFTHSYNKATKELKMNSSNLPLENIEIYNILGQNVNTKGLSKVSETVNIASLNDGVYIAKVSIGGNSKTFKFVKN